MSKFTTVLGVKVQKQIYYLMDQCEMSSNDLALIRALLNDVAFSTNNPSQHQQRLEMAIEIFPRVLEQSKALYQALEDWYQEEKEVIEALIIQEAQAKRDEARKEKLK
ncbi:hypothetical protein QV08_04820 [Gallibacterium salpingitidis]|uniref:Uncharacterized protein n=1 Tax=Gallibacterium salpingitidis TaxID=505341 RepID=A0AB36E4I5_9PAST|nr:hypothetical protein [Gallibacterium salpingitidis]OBX08528.1 hypothetical protein QV08_04820 [Gallibacterium salpingitidis]OBX11616.1 hypothetical protein QV09_01785 [Gallibacterium salpingitidis]WKS99024.1 hypothetical protein NYR30_09750 [Gallibacterium salpingitidis]